MARRYRDFGPVTGLRSQECGRAGSSRRWLTGVMAPAPTGLEEVVAYLIPPAARGSVFPRVSKMTLLTRTKVRNSSRTRRLRSQTVKSASRCRDSSLVVWAACSHNRRPIGSPGHPGWRRRCPPLVPDWPGPLHTQLRQPGRGPGLKAPTTLPRAAQPRAPARHPGRGGRELMARDMLEASVAAGESGSVSMLAGKLRTTNPDRIHLRHRQVQNEGHQGLGLAGRRADHGVQAEPEAA